MIALKHFFETERREKGWHFWFLWVLATNIGFFPGLALGNYLMNLVMWGISEAALGAAVFILFTSLAHFVVLRRHLPDKAEWVLSSTLGWTLGIALMAPLLQALTPWLEPGTPNHTMTLGFLAGPVLGGVQLPMLKRHFPQVSWWWLLVSAVGWGGYFPGMVTGFVLVFLFRERSHAVATLTEKELVGQGSIPQAHPG